MSICSNVMSGRIVRDLRIEVFGHLNRMPLGFIDSHRIGDIISRVVSDADQFSDGLLMGFTQAFAGITTILGTLVFMLFLF